MGDYIDSWCEEACGEDCFVEVLECVGAFHFEGAHGACEDDGDMDGVADSFLEPFSGLAQGVGAVEDDDSRAD